MNKLLELKETGSWVKEVINAELKLPLLDFENAILVREE